MTPPAKATTISRRAQRERERPLSPTAANARTRVRSATGRRAGQATGNPMHWGGIGSLQASVNPSRRRPATRVTTLAITAEGLLDSACTSPPSSRRVNDRGSGATPTVF
ncbi:hypothetical protein B0T42_04145 [Rathayibacter sp. VKM Ac-2630]|nr:hypothetical protein B0T42_04145 [Rathayibacter sp. VKM Ac-2630]